MYACHKDVFALQLHIESIQVNSVHQQGQMSEPLWVGEVFSVEEGLLMEEVPDFLLRVAHI